MAANTPITIVSVDEHQREERLRALRVVPPSASCHEARTMIGISTAVMRIRASAMPSTPTRVVGAELLDPRRGLGELEARAAGRGRRRHAMARRARAARASAICLARSRPRARTRGGMPTSGMAPRTVGQGSGRVIAVTRPARAAARRPGRRRLPASTARRSGRTRSAPPGPRGRPADERGEPVDAAVDAAAVEEDQRAGEVLAGPHEHRLVHRVAVEVGRAATVSGVTSSGARPAPAAAVQPRGRDDAADQHEQRDQRRARAGRWCARRPPRTARRPARGSAAARRPARAGRPRRPSRSPARSSARS